MDYTDLSPGLTESARQSLEAVYGGADMSTFLARLTGGENPVTPEGLKERIRMLFSGELRAGMGLLGALAAILLLFAVAEHFSRSLSAGTLGKTVGLVLSASAAALGVKGYLSALSVARDAVESMIFFTRYAGVGMAYLAAASGAPVSGPAMLGVLSAGLSLIGDLLYRVILPLSAVGVGLGVLHYAFLSVPLEGAMKLANSAVKWILGLFSTLFTALLGITGMAAGSLDGMGGKTVKFMISSLVPVVGAALAEAADTVAGAGTVTKNAVGALGLLFLIGIALLPVLRLASAALLFRLTAAASEMLMQKRCAGMFSVISGGVTLLFAVVAILSVLFGVSLALMIRCTDFGVSFR